MNTGPDTHLDLEDLIAREKDTRARDHLARCQDCQLEADRWTLVADGVRSLTAATPQTAQPAAPPRARTRPRRRTVLAASAAALALLGAAGYGVAAALTWHTPGPVLTAVTGCATLEQATGTLTRVTGTSLDIKTASGQPVTVTITPSATLGVSGRLLSGIPDGTPVSVAGPRSGQTITAVTVAVRSSFAVQGPAGSVTVSGTVSDASTAGFTVVTSAGTRVPVTTTSYTLVAVFQLRPAQLPVGAAITAVGHGGPDGTLVASAVMAIVQPSSGPQLHFHANVKPRGCSPAAIVSDS
jgi:hypothetical protein